MKALLSIVTAAVSLGLLGSPALAQAPTEQPPVVAKPTANLTVEHRHVIKELIKELHVQSVGSDIKVAVGTAVPPSVSLRPMPSVVAEKVPQVKSHEFFVKEDQIALVDPKNRMIVEVIE